MNNRIKRLFVLILDNKVVHLDSNLSSFVNELKSLDAGFKSLSYYTKYFKENDIEFHATKFGKMYTIQKWSY